MVGNDTVGQGTSADASDPSTASVRMIAPGKINLHLRVGPVAADGFHPVLTWMVTVGLFDTLDLQLGPREIDLATGAVPLVLTCDDPALPRDASNLVVSAADALHRAASSDGLSPSGAVVARLSKRIPTGGGLGGGSSDASATLLGLNRIWRLGFSRDRLAAIAAAIGSDVPFFLHGVSGICTGRGEIVRETAPPLPKACVLLLPRGMHLPTPEVYRRFDDLRLGSERDIELPPAWDSFEIGHGARKRDAVEGSPGTRDPGAVDPVAGAGAGWSSLPAEQLLPRLVNDLEAPAFGIEPALGRLRSDAEQRLGRPVRMSGSGSSLFTLYDTDAQAQAASEEVEAAIPQLSVVATKVAWSPPALQE